MAALDSVAFFRGRMEAMGIEQAVVAIMLNRGWNSLASFAYSCGYMPGVGDETPFKQDVLKALLGDDYETNPNAPRLRRLFMESHTLAISDLRRRAERTDADMPVKLPVEERQVRKQKLQLRLPGIEIEGPSEPSNALVDLLAQQLESGVLRYVPWSACTTKHQEIQGEKKASIQRDVIRKDAQGFLRSESQPETYVANLESDLLLTLALERRALAFELAAVAPYEVMASLNKKLMKEYMKPPRPLHSKVTLDQVEMADRQAFNMLAELTASGLSQRPDRTWPLQDAMAIVLNDPEFHYLLMQSQAAASGTKRPHSPEATKRPAAKATAKAKAKAKASPRPPVDATKTGNRSEDGKPLCFGFNLGTCKVKNVKPGARCPRGFHSCWIKVNGKVCGKPHCAADHS
jgi:hypothetical protein